MDGVTHGQACVHAELGHRWYNTLGKRERCHCHYFVREFGSVEEYHSFAIFLVLWRDGVGFFTLEGYNGDGGDGNDDDEEDVDGDIGNNL